MPQNFREMLTETRTLALSLSYLFCGHGFARDMHNRSESDVQQYVQQHTKVIWGSISAGSAGKPGLLNRLSRGTTRKAKSTISDASGSDIWMSAMAWGSNVRGESCLSRCLTKQKKQSSTPQTHTRTQRTWEQPLQKNKQLIFVLAGKHSLVGWKMVPSVPPWPRRPKPRIRVHKGVVVGGGSAKVNLN